MLKSVLCATEKYLLPVIDVSKLPTNFDVDDTAAELTDVMVLALVELSAGVVLPGDSLASASSFTLLKYVSGGPPAAADP
jgi:hypothetical protein